MADAHIRAAFYLSPTLDALWRWGDGATVLTWADETTIAFGAEVTAVLRRLAPGGLPPFGAVALVLGACRDGWSQSTARQTIEGYTRVFNAMGVSATSEVPAQAANAVFHRVARDITRLLAGLDHVNQLPASLREGVTAKSVLAELVFEEARNRCSPEDAALVITALEEGLNPETLAAQACSEESLSQFAEQVDGLDAGLARVDSDALARRLATGIDQAIMPPEEDIAPPDRIRNLLGSLLEDRELGGLAGLAQQLMAAVSVPRSLRMHDELSIGGVSDLSNRGSLDRLLVSELAHDDLTLSIRIALNEALYLRRESPPGEPPHRRAILIDSGIRMWGVPRVFATAAAMALAATNDRRAALAVYRASTRAVDPVDLTTRKGLEQHLAVLETPPHPGSAIKAFFQALHDAGPEPTDAILVTHADALADPEFLVAAQTLGESEMYVATVDREGVFRLVVLTRAGIKPVREARLSLEDVLADRRPGSGPRAIPLVAPDQKIPLPVIFSVEPFPFLLPYVADLNHVARSARHGLVAVAADGRMLHWRDGNRGARQLTSRVPAGTIRAVWIDDARAQANAVVMPRRQTAAHIVRASLETAECASFTLTLRDRNPVHVFIHAGDIYAVYRRRIDAFNTRGDFLASVALERHAQWAGGRFFKSGGRYLAIAYDGSNTLRMDQVPWRPDALAMFDRDGHDGLWAIMSDGRILEPSGKEFAYPKPSFKQSFAVVGVSLAGDLVAMQFDGAQRLLHLGGGSDNAVTYFRATGENHKEALLSPQIYWSTRSCVTARNRFRGVAFDQTGRLSLFAPSGGVFVISLNDAGELILMECGQGTSTGANVRRFEPVRGLRIRGCRLTLARWADGSEVWLDSRGLIHLKSSDRRIPQLSIVLTNILPAAWSSEAKVCGPSFFIGDAVATEGGYFEELIRWFASKLR